VSITTSSPLQPLPYTALLHFTNNMPSLAEMQPSPISDTASGGTACAVSMTTSSSLQPLPYTALLLSTR
jgi:hypothetical protein